MTVAGANQLFDHAVTLGFPDLFSWSYPIPEMQTDAVHNYLSARHFFRYS